jgi:survival of motor neuron protein-interacting protein 1
MSLCQMNGAPTSSAVVEEERPYSSSPLSSEEVVEDCMKDNDGVDEDDRHCKRRRKDKDIQQSATIDDVNISSPLTLDDVASMDVNTFLAHVDRQRRALPDVFVAPPLVRNIDAPSAMSTSSLTNNYSTDIHESGSLSTMRVFLSDKFDILPPPSPHHLPPSSVNDQDRPGRTWVEDTIAKFSHLRILLEKKSCIRQQQGKGMERLYEVPRMRDRAGWHVYCLGKEQAYGNISGYHYDDDEDDDNDNDNDENDIDEEEEACDDTEEINKNEERGHEEGEHKCPLQTIWEDDAGHTPTISLLLQFDQVLIRSIFAHHVHYFIEWKMPLTSERASWLYALLARMEKPLHREECVAVRGVLRECCRRRWELIVPLPPSSDSPSIELDLSITHASSVEVEVDHDRKGTNGDDDHDNITMWRTTTLTKGDQSNRGVHEQLALLNTLIAITGVYFKQGFSSAASAGGLGNNLDSLFVCQATNSK